MSDRPVRSVKSLHTEAMALAQEAYVRHCGGDGDAIRALCRQAAALEREALDRVRDIPNNEPTYSILERSLRSLENQAEEKP